MSMQEFQNIVDALVMLVSAVGALVAAYHTIKARAAIEQHVIAAQGKDRVISDLVTVANMEPEVAAAVSPLIAAVKAVAAGPTPPTS